MCQILYKTFCAMLRPVNRLCLTLCGPWTIAHQTPLSMGFFRQECWSGLTFPTPGDLPDPGIKHLSPALAPGKPYKAFYYKVR